MTVGPRANEYHPAFEEYCETIYELHEDDVGVIQARIADRLEVSRPAVSEMTKRMELNGLITVERGTIHLTDAGLTLAETVVRRHRIAERFLTDMLGLSWSSAHAEAGKWEHVISDEVEEALTRVLGEPTTCPHGNPIPGSAYAPTPTVTLADVPDGSAFVVSRIPEELEFTAGMLDFLESNSLRPGCAGVVRSRVSDGTTQLEIGGREVSVGAFACDRILVRAA